MPVRFNLNKYYIPEKNYSIKEELRTYGNRERSVGKAQRGEKIISNIDSLAEMYDGLVSNLIKEVKVANQRNQTTLSIDLKKYNTPLPEGIAKIIANALYRIYGIKVKSVDQLDEPTTMQVKWGLDNTTVNLENNFFQGARKNGFCTDFAFKITGSKSEFKCHKILLASKCPYFNTLFSGEFKDSKLNEIELPESISPDMVEFFLDWIYEGKNSLPPAMDMTALIQLHTLSDLYLMKLLKNQCQYQLVQRINLNTVQDLLTFAAEGKGIKKLTEACELFLIDEIKDSKDNLDEIAQFAAEFKLSKLAEELSSQQKK